MTLIGLPSLGLGSLSAPRAQPSTSLVPTSHRSYKAPSHYLPPPDHPGRSFSDHAPHLKIQLTELLDEGGSSLVYAATAVGCDSAPLQLPPLVVKLARRCRRGHIAREAWFYDELYELQGSVIPRCYGWFDAPEDPKSFQGAAYAPDSDKDVNLGRPAYIPHPWSAELDELAKPKDRISFLLLERLGSRMPFNVPLSNELRYVPLVEV